MAWNDNGNGKDPWKREDQEPNDLDQIVENWQRRLGALFGGGKSPGGGGSGGGYFLFILALGAWALTGFYRVDEAERGVVQRFGAYVGTTLPGLRWHAPFPIETVDIVNTVVVTDYAYQTEMLTADEQYVFINMVVQYRRSDPVKYSFEVADPESTLQDVTESALREVVGTSELETLVGGRRDEIASRTLQALQDALDSYNAGFTVTSISLEDVKYPQDVQAAVDEAQRARNDSERYILEADAYARDIIPRARGEAAQVIEEAQAYRNRVVGYAEGEASRFEALLTEYAKAPQVTRDRLYIDAIEEVYSNSTKIILDSEGSGNLLYLPIDKLMQNSGYSSSADRSRFTESATLAPDDESRSAQEARERRTRQ